MKLPDCDTSQAGPTQGPLEWRLLTSSSVCRAGLRDDPHSTSPVLLSLWNWGFIPHSIALNILYPLMSLNLETAISLEPQGTSHHTSVWSQERPKCSGLVTSLIRSLGPWAGGGGGEGGRAGTPTCLELPTHRTPSCPASKFHFSTCSHMLLLTSSSPLLCDGSSSLLPTAGLLFALPLLHPKLQSSQLSPSTLSLTGELFASKHFLSHFTTTKGVEGASGRSRKKKTTAFPGSSLLLWSIFLPPSLIQDLPSPQTPPRLLTLSELRPAEQLAECLVAEQAIPSLVLTLIESINLHHPGELGSYVVFFSSHPRIQLGSFTV